MSHRMIMLIVSRIVEAGQEEDMVDGVIQATEEGMEPAAGNHKHKRNKGFRPSSNQRRYQKQHGKQ